nr:family 16 glycosylhydrolase [uncultured Flavobacterium sp.]
MKKILINIAAFFSLLLMVNCQEDNFSFGDVNAPSNLQVAVEIIGKTAGTPDGDGSGKVKFTAKASDAISYKFVFGDGISANAPSGVSEHLFTTVGVNTYTVTVIASGKGGVSSSITVDVTVRSDFSDEKSTQLLTGGTAAGKKWYIAAAEKGHLGVGPNSDNAGENYFPLWYQAGAFEKSATCFYDGDYTFALVNGKIEFKQDNKGNTFFNNAYKSVAGGTNGGDDQCLTYSTAGTKIVALSPSTSVVSKNPDAAKQSTGTVMNFSDGGFMGYYAGAAQYEIMSISENRMVVRFVQENNDGLAWYQTFTTSLPGGTTDNTDYTNLVWSDEFNTDGAPDPAKWTYDLGKGDNGWGNNEKQNYTNLAKNVKILGGNLVITAIKEASGGAEYSSARIKTQGLYDFKYGKIEMKAKMPTGAGTWPAFWSLGASPGTWPAIGEIDFMEWIGNKPLLTQAALHYPGSSGGNAAVKTTAIANASSEFHIYKTIWSPKTIRFFVDDVLFFTFDNSNTDLPFHKNFFMIMNVAMGGNLGGAIDPAFTQSAMEVDYVKVFQ